DDTDDGVVIVQYGGRGGPAPTIRVHDVDDWHAGQRVTLLADPESSFVTLPGENFLPDWFTAAIVFGLFVGTVLVIVGVVVCRHAHARLTRKARSPGRTAYGSAVHTVNEGSTVTVAYFRSIAGDVLWRVGPRFPAGPVVAEVAGDATGSMIRLRGQRH